VYAEQHKQGRRWLIDFADAEQCTPASIGARAQRGPAARRRVSGGLDSLVMGEGQILAQVRQVYKVGQAAPGFGRHLNGLFKQAITAGKRVRAETSIASGAVSVSSAAAELAQLKLPSHDFADAQARACALPRPLLVGSSGSVDVAWVL